MKKLQDNICLFYKRNIELEKKIIGIDLKTQMSLKLHKDHVNVQEFYKNHMKSKIINKK